jgi:ankyrin repeat protein
MDDQTKLAPIHVAASAGNLDIVKYIMSLGADPKMKDGNGNMPIFHAKNKEIREYFVAIAAQ